MKKRISILVSSALFLCISHSIMAQNVADTLRGKNANPDAPVNVADREKRPQAPAVRQAIPVKSNENNVFNVVNDKPSPVPPAQKPVRREKKP
jgi:hypothetical protein